MRYRCDSYRNNDTLYYRENKSDPIVRKCTYRDGFDRAMKSYDFPEFEKFFRDSVFKGLYPEKPSKHAKGFTVSTL
jgi:hypothetical protein